ncbi:hypothetical protein SOVF_003060 [Spinacia oleracea]|nr:hypothetical protein SOVF_003060 [Spinacia oleracea]
MSSVQNQKSSIDHSLSFEDVSKLFSLPLSEAADILGASTSVLKKICNENGLERWPHRKYLAGKSIEDIKNEAAKEKSKPLRGVSPKSNVTTSSPATSSPSSRPNIDPPSINPRITDPDRTRPITNNAQQQPGSKAAAATWRSNQMLASGLTTETSTDEFKYGFPSTGLSECTYRWWGRSFNGGNGVSKDDTKTNVEDDDDATCEEKTDSMEEDNRDEVSLSGIRKRAMEEGKKALKFNVLKKYGVDKLGNEEKILLRRLYQTS